MEEINSARVLWCDDADLENRDRDQDGFYQFTGLAIFHSHKGEISIDDEIIRLQEIDNGLLEIIPLSLVQEIYIGFDELYTRILSKNIGLFWSPLRLTLQNFRKIYLVIDYNGLYTKNKTWFSLIKERLINFSD